MTRYEAIQFLDNMKHEEAGRAIGKDGFYAELISYHVQALNIAIKALEQEPCEDAISRSELLKAIDTWDRFGVDDTNSLFRLDNLSLPHYVPYIHYDDVVKCIKGMPSVTPKQKMGHWITKDGKQQGYDIGGVNTWYIQIMCDKCGFIKTAIEGHTGQYKYCPNCGTKMNGVRTEPYKAESEDKKCTKRR